MEESTTLRASLKILAQRAEPPRFSQLWTALSLEERREAIEASIESHPDELLPEMSRKLMSLPGHRPQVVRQWPIGRMVQAATRLTFEEPVLRSLLISLHVGRRGPMLAQFLDDLGVEHENGEITGDVDAPPAPAAEIHRAANRLAEWYPIDQVVTYFLTQIALDPPVWSDLREWLADRAP
jgi:hypothetical protein